MSDGDFGPIALAIALTLIVGALLMRVRQQVIVYPWDAVLLYRDGVFERVLEPGVHRYVDLRQRVKIVQLANYPQRTAFGATDVISADRFAFRIHPTITWSIADPRAAWEAQEVSEFGGYGSSALSDRVAASALAAVGGRTLDEVVGDPQAVADAIRARLAETVTTLTIEAASVTRIELPPETRRMLTDVERARREGLAALERARAEQASLRALANAARLVKDNPELARLRLLKTIEDAKGPTTIILGDPRMVPPAA